MKLNSEDIHIFIVIYKQGVYYGETNSRDSRGKQNYCH